MDPPPAFSGVIDDRRGRRALAIVALTLGVVVSLGLLLPADDDGIAVSDAAPSASGMPALTSPAATPRHPLEVAAASLLAPPDAGAVGALPTAGPIAPGWYHDAPDESVTDFGCCRDGFLRFAISTTGWSNATSGPPGHTLVLATGQPGTPDRVTLRFGPISTVYQSPCDGTVVPSGSADSVAGLTTALASISGAPVSAPARVRLRWSTASWLAITFPADLPCDDRAAVPWSGDPGGARRPAIPRATSRIWIFNPNGSEGFGRTVIEAETLPGIDRALLDEIDAIVASIDHGG